MSTSAKASNLLDSNTFTAGQNNNINSNVYNNYGSAQGVDFKQILRKHVAIGALHDSDERSVDPPKCHPQTRTAILGRIDQWATDASKDGKPIFWLSGPAGAGKSAIAQTLVEIWKKKGINVAAFFFWRTASERNQKTRLVPTIAIQLMELFPSIQSRIEAAVSSIGFFERSLSFQLDRLVVEPLCSIPQDQSPVVILIDGLDECCVDLPKVKDFPGQDYESQQREILEVLASACSTLAWVRFLIVSRPERQIRESFGKGPLKERTFPLSLKDAPDAEADICLFLDCKFEEIRQQHGIGASWPTKAQLDELVRKSSGQFIYPSVAIKHITRARANPVQNLQAVLELPPGSVDKPLEELDMLYTLILKSVSSPSLPVVNDVLGYLITHERQSHRNLNDIFVPETVDLSARMFEKFRCLSEGEVNFHLTDLHSVLDVHSDAQSAISLMHATFSEYLLDQSRSGNFFIGKESISERFTLQLRRHLQKLGSSSDQTQYNEGNLLKCFCTWIDACSPSKSLAVYLWSLLRIEIGGCPFSALHTTNFPPVASDQLSARFTSQMKAIDANSGGIYWIRDLLIYLRECNTPEIEPAWWRRFLIRRRLKAAFERFSRK